ncbi:hypothetical protein MRBLWS13_001936 [Microbacterium sp. LWS13-1.2]|uniref:Uncharacterized protein n=1 Tax=Microbacterium sp. LWS13-1.2 TaxID=3135264 RepID=A0AAU6SBF2_9MICO
MLLRVFHALGTRTEPTALKDARIFARGHVQLLDMKPHVEGGIDARSMVKALPDALITTGGRHGRFHERVIRQFGFRGDATLLLLHKTQSAKNLGTLDALFRGFMLDQPGTLSRAETAVEQFTELDAAHKHVVDLRKQADALHRVDDAWSSSIELSLPPSWRASEHRCPKPPPSSQSCWLPPSPRLRAMSPQCRTTCVTLRVSRERHWTRSRSRFNRGGITGAISMRSSWERGDSSRMRSACRCRRSPSPAS